MQRNYEKFLTILVLVNYFRIWAQIEKGLKNAKLELIQERRADSSEPAPPITDKQITS